jgi:hypothetical protein
LLADVPERRRDDCWWLVLQDGTLVPGDAGGGGGALLAEVRLTRRLGRFLRVVGAEPLIDAFDKLVSHHRGRLGRLVPDGPAPRRYP